MLLAASPLREARSPGALPRHPGERRRASSAGLSPSPCPPTPRPRTLLRSSGTQAPERPHRPLELTCLGGAAGTTACLRSGKGQGEPRPSQQPSGRRRHASVQCRRRCPPGEGTGHGSNLRQSLALWGRLCRPHPHAGFPRPSREGTENPRSQLNQAPLLSLGAPATLAKCACRQRRHPRRRRPAFPGRTPSSPAQELEA